jgi:hypothetical protein
MTVIDSEGLKLEDLEHEDLSMMLSENRFALFGIML